MMQRGVFHRPGLGLVIQVTAWSGLPALVSSLGQMLALPDDVVAGHMLLAAGSLVLAAVTRIVLGLAFERRPTLVPLALGVHVAVVIAATVISVMAVGVPLSKELVVGVLVDAIVGPGLLIAGCLVAPVTDSSQRRSAGEVGLGLVARGVASAVSSPIQAVLLVRELASAHPAPQQWIWALSWPMVLMIGAMLQLIAGIILWRGGWQRGRRALLAWLIVTVGLGAITGLVGVIDLMTTSMVPRHLLVTPIVLLVTGPIVPLVIWRYATKIVEGDDARDGAMTMGGWLAISLAPMIVGGAFAIATRGQDQTLTGLAVLAMFAGLIGAIAGFAAIRGHRATVVFATGASLVSITLAVIGSWYVIKHREGVQANGLWLLVFVAAVPVLLALSSLRLARDQVSPSEP